MINISNVGFGYDIHRLVKGRRLFLGGVLIPHRWGLLGHSDADVLLHAICDALLGAAGKGDIGEHFPNKDPRFKGISSLQLLTRVKTMVKKAQYRIGHIDTMVLVEEPNLQEYKPAMRKKIAGALAINENQINIKATTQEGMGFGSGKKAIAAYAVAVLEKES